jgi:hypothetical protein
VSGHSIYLGAATLVLSALISEPSFAFRSGPPAGQNGSIASGGATCRQCHGNAVGNGEVQILGAPTEYEASALYDLIIRVSDPAQAGAGFQLSVETGAGAVAGTLIVSDAVHTQLNPNAGGVWINHTTSGVNNSVANWAAMGNAAEYQMQWEAPPADVGPVTFWVAGNAINNDFFNSGDIIYLHDQSATFTTGVVPAASAWGLVIMTLIVFTAGTQVIRRRVSTADRAH